MHLNPESSENSSKDESGMKLSLEIWEKFIHWFPALTFPSSTASHSTVSMLLLPSSRVLEPYLSHTFTQPRQWGYSLEILSIWIAIYLEISLKDLQLILGESSSHPLRFALAVTVQFTTIWNIKDIFWLQGNSIKPLVLPSLDVVPPSTISI